MKIFKLSLFFASLIFCALAFNSCQKENIVDLQNESISDVTEISERMNVSNNLLGATTSCGGVTITYGNGTISINGGTGYHYKIFNQFNYTNPVAECINNCPATFTKTNLQDGNYRIEVWNAPWDLVCGDPEKHVTLSSGGSTNCGSVGISYGNGTISINGGVGYHYKIFNQFNYTNPVAECINNCPATFTKTNLQSGNYRIEVWNAPWDLVCGDPEKHVTL